MDAFLVIIFFIVSFFSIIQISITIISRYYDISQVPLVSYFVIKQETEVDENFPPVKKSTSGICHTENGNYYYKTFNFIAYNSVEECLDSGGQLPIK